ncbi:MAG: hypothetical protein J6P98_03255, partial [Clostridia bacterium]|nr:hypothetical protein [Clostridia bacterium]
MPERTNKSEIGERMRRAREQRRSSQGEEPKLALSSRPYYLRGKNGVTEAPVLEVKKHSPASLKKKAAEREELHENPAEEELTPILGGERIDAEEMELIRIVKKDEAKLEKLRKAEEREERKKERAAAREQKKLEKQLSREQAELEAETEREETEAEKLSAKEQRELEAAEKKEAREERREQKKLEKQGRRERAAKLREKKREERRERFADEGLRKRLRRGLILGGILLLLAGGVVFFYFFAQVETITVG